MRPNSNALALRDPAAAILMGAMVAPGSNFGADFGSDFGGDFNGDDYGDDYGYDSGSGWEFGDDYGWEFGADPAAAAHAALATAPPAVANHPAVKAAVHHAAHHAARGAHPAAGNPAAMKALREMQKSQAHTERRSMLLEPNKNSRVKVERYVFAVNAAITLGTAGAINATGQPDTNIRPQRCTMNAPQYGFITVTELKVANVSVSIGGTLDAFDFNANGVGQGLDMPLLTPANRATVLGNYTGFVPPGFVGGTAYTFVASFKGPATIVA